MPHLNIRVLVSDNIKVTLQVCPPGPTFFLQIHADPVSALALQRVCLGTIKTISFYLKVMFASRTRQVPRKAECIL